MNLVRRLFRSAKSGRFVSALTAREHPDTTVGERIERPGPSTPAARRDNRAQNRRSS